MIDLLEKIGFFFAFRLLVLLAQITAVVSVIYLLSTALTGVGVDSAGAFLVALMQVIGPLWLLLFLLATPCLLARLDRHGIRRRPGGPRMDWNTVDRVSVSSLPGARFLDKVTLSSDTASVSIYLGQYRHRKDLLRCIAAHLDWVEQAQLETPCSITRPG